MFTVESHEYDPETGIDTYILQPGGMTTLVKVVEEDGELKVMVGAPSQGNPADMMGNVDWSPCKMPDIIEFALADYETRK